LSILRKISGIDFRNPNLWEFYFEDATDMRFYVRSTSLPFIKFDTYTRNTGTKHRLTIYLDNNELQNPEIH
jgi:hypothetical protein